MKPSERTNIYLCKNPVQSKIVLFYNVTIESIYNSDSPLNYYLYIYHQFFLNIYTYI